MSVFATAMNAIFGDRNMAVDVVYTPEGGAPVTLRAIRTAPDRRGDFGQTVFQTESTMFDLRCSDIDPPRAGDRLQVGSEAYLIQGEPQRDEMRLVWTIDTRPAP